MSPLSITLILRTSLTTLGMIFMLPILSTISSQVCRARRARVSAPLSLSLTQAQAAHHVQTFAPGLPRMPGAQLGLSILPSQHADLILITGLTLPACSAHQFQGLGFGGPRTALGEVGM